VQVNSILAIEKSDEFDDWRELIRLYMVRRTRSFIIQHYTEADKQGRRFISGKDGEKALLSRAQAHVGHLQGDEADPADRYARLYSRHVVDEINALHVPRYGWACTLTRSEEKASHAGRTQTDREPGPRRQAAHGLLPHQPVQAAGVQRLLVPAIDRPAHPAQPDLPVRH
jgi:hypothetical protein